MFSNRKSFLKNLKIISHGLDLKLTNLIFFFKISLSEVVGCSSHPPTPLFWA